MGLGGGNDGGVIAAKRRFLVREKKRDRVVETSELQAIRWTTCSLSSEPLHFPVLADQLGNLYNKEAIIKYLLAKTKLPSFAHIKSLKSDLKELKVPSNTDKLESVIVCPLSRTEGKGNAKFVYLLTCGHVFLEKALHEVEAADNATATRAEKDGTGESDENGASSVAASSHRCPECNTKYSVNDIIRLNPSPTEAIDLRTAMEARKQARRLNRKQKKSADQAKNETTLDGVSKKHRVNSNISEQNSTEKDSLTRSSAPKRASLVEDVAKRVKEARQKGGVYASLFHDESAPKRSAADLYMRTATGIYSQSRG